MNCLKIIKCMSVKVGSSPIPTSPPQCNQLTILYQGYRNISRYPSLCEIMLRGPDKRPCFDIRKLIIERATACHSKMIKSFLYANYWPREPTVTSLWLPLTSSYLEVLSDRYSCSGDRLLAFERMERTNENKLVGVLVAHKIYPWIVQELEDWANYACIEPEKSRLYFLAHCYRDPNIFQKYNVPYVYDIGVLGTIPEVTGQGVATQLLKRCLKDAVEYRIPLVHHIALSTYMTKVCERNGMKAAWSMKYSDFRNLTGEKVFYPRRPHDKATIYLNYNDPLKGGELPCKPPFL